MLSLVVASPPDDQHAAAAARPNPVFRQRDRLRRAGARRVHLGVRPARADVLGELAVAHRQDAEEEAPVERVRLALHLARAARGSGGRSRAAAPSSDVYSRRSSSVGQLLQLAFPPVVALELARRTGRARGTRSQRSRRFRRGAPRAADSGRADSVPLLVFLNVWTSGMPASCRASRPAAIAICDARSSASTSLSGTPYSSAQVERPGLSRQLDHVGDVVDRLEAAAAVLRLHQPRDPLAHHRFAGAARAAAR